MVLAVIGLAGAHALVSDGANAAQLLGVAEELRGVGPVLAPWMLDELARVEALTRSILGDSAYEDAHRAGRLQADALLGRLVADGERSHS